MAVRSEDAAMDAAARLMDGGWKACGTRRAHTRSRSVTDRRENAVADFMQSSMASARVKVAGKKMAESEQRGLYVAAKSLGYNTNERRQVTVMSYEERGVWYVHMQKLEEVRRD